MDDGRSHMERPQSKKMKKRCAIPEKKLKELESILHQAIALPLPHINEEEDAYETESRQRRFFLVCEEIDQRSFFLHSLLIAEISSCPSPPSEEAHLINIQRCFDALHHAYHEWNENSDPTLLQRYLGSDRPQPQCTASCFNTDVEDEEDEDIGELTESIVSTQMSENPMELECCDDVGAVVPAAEMVSVGVQTDSLLQEEEESEEEEEEEEESEEEKMKSTDCFREVTETEDEWEAEAEAEAEPEPEPEEEEEEQQQEAEEEVVLVGASAAVAKGVVWMGCGMMMVMGFMIGRFYYGFFNSNRCCFDYYCYSRVGGGGVRLPT